MNIKGLIGSGDKIMLFTLPFIIVGLICNILYPSVFQVGGPSGPFMILAVGLLAVGVAVWLWSAVMILTQASQGKLMTSGPYAWVLHPLYTGVALLVLPGVGFVCNSWLGVPLGIALYVGSRLFSPEEEKKLSGAFGPAWAEYRRRVRIPWL
jgi:protein-S-isoprenylcysteine O-methyltransferase Ste14